MGMDNSGDNDRIHALQGSNRHSLHQIRDKHREEGRKAGKRDGMDNPIKQNH